MLNLLARGSPLLRFDRAGPYTTLAIHAGTCRRHPANDRAIPSTCRFPYPDSGHAKRLPLRIRNRMVRIGPAPELSRVKPNLGVHARPRLGGRVDQTSGLGRSCMEMARPARKSRNCAALSSSRWIPLATSRTMGGDWSPLDAPVTYACTHMMSQWVLISCVIRSLTSEFESCRIMPGEPQKSTSGDLSRC